MEERSREQLSKLVRQLFPSPNGGRASSLPALHGHFGMTNHHAWSDLLCQRGPIVYVQHLEGTRNHWLMSCGSQAGPEGPGVLLNLEVVARTDKGVAGGI